MCVLRENRSPNEQRGHLSWQGPEPQTMETVGESAQTEENYGFQTVEHGMSHDHCNSTWPTECTDHTYVSGRKCQKWRLIIS